MKALQRPDLFAWSSYQEHLRIDFNGFLWTRPTGNVLFDPMALSEPDRRHLLELGGATWILLTNSAHVRAALDVVALTGAKLAGPAGERASFPVPCDRWLSEGDEPFPGLRTHAMEGSKTEGELAFVIEDTTAIFGDLVRAHRAGSLMLLAREKLRDPARARDSLRRFRALQPSIANVLVGDGWCAFRNGGALLDELLATAGST
jgi:hypothetical protein